MRRVTVLSLGVVLLSACSLTENPGPPLRMLWETGPPVDPPSGRAATDSEHFYTIRGRGGGVRQLRAYDRRSGAPVWSSAVNSVCSPPIARDSRVYCPAEGIQAYDARTGQPLWTARPDIYFGLAAGTADAQRVYAASLEDSARSGSVVAVDAATGRVLWERSYNDDTWRGIVFRGLTLSPEGDLLVSFGASFQPYTTFSVAVIVALNPATGEERWRFVDGDRTTYRQTGDLELWEDLMLYSDPTGQEAVAVSRTTRQVVWRVPFTPNSFSTYRPPLVKDGVAFFTDTQGGVFAVDARTGQLRWKNKQPYGYLSHEVCGQVVFGDNLIGDVFDRATGKLLGQPLGPDDIPNQATVADDVLYLSADSGVYAFDCNL